MCFDSYGIRSIAEVAEQIYVYKEKPASIVRDCNISEVEISTPHWLFYLRWRFETGQGYNRHDRYKSKI